MKKYCVFALSFFCLCMVAIILTAVLTRFVNGFFYSNKTIEIAISAFAGAFFSFGFLRVGEALMELYKRKKQHFNALVKLEFLCSDNLNTLEVNMDILNKFIESTKLTMAEKSIHMFYNRFEEQSVDRSILLDIYSHKLINCTYAYFIDIERINSDFSTMKSIYDQNNLLLKERGIIEEYKINMGRLCENLEALKPYLVLIEKKTKNILAMTRISLKDKPWIVRYLEYIGIASKDIAQKQIDMELKEIEKEQALIQQKPIN